MIESKENRKLIEETIERWTRHTKVKPQLRDYDVPNLVSSILDIFYHIHLSCGCLVRDFNEATDIEFEDVFLDEDGHHTGIVTCSVCKDCLEVYKTFPKFRVIANTEGGR